MITESEWGIRDSRGLWWSGKRNSDTTAWTDKYDRIHSFINYSMAELAREKLIANGAKSPLSVMRIQ